MAEIPGPTPNGEREIATRSVDFESLQHDDVVAVLRENERLRREIARLQHQVSRFPSIEQQEAEFAEAQELERKHGIVFRRVPQGVYPGQRYLLPQDLLRQRKTAYSKGGIYQLIRDKVLSTGELAGKTILFASGVRDLFVREADQAGDASPLRRPRSGGERSL